MLRPQRKRAALLHVNNRAWSSEDASGKDCHRSGTGQSPKTQRVMRQSL